MSVATEGVKLDRLEFSLDVCEGIPVFDDPVACAQHFGLPMVKGIAKFRFGVRLASDVVLYLTNRRGNVRQAPGKLIVGHDTSNRLPLDRVISILSRYLPTGVSFRRLSRVDVASDKFIPFDDFIAQVFPLGVDKHFCKSEFRVQFYNGVNPNTYQFGKHDIVVRFYDKQVEQGVDFSWSRVEMQFRNKIIRETGEHLTDVDFLDSLIQLTSHCCNSFFRPLKKFVPGHYEQSEVCDYWLELFSALADYDFRLSRNVYYV